MSLVGMATLGINYGTRNTFGLFLRPLAEAFGATRGFISLTLAINFLFYGAVIFGVGWLIDRFGPRVVMVWGMVMGAFGWWAASLANSPIFILLTFGVVFGLATAMLSQVTCTSLVSKCSTGKNRVSIGFYRNGTRSRAVYFHAHTFRPDRFFFMAMGHGYRRGILPG